MADQGSGIESRGIGNKPPRRMSEAISNACDDQIQKPTTQADKAQTEGEDQFRNAGPRSTPPNNGLNRNPFHLPARSSPEPATRPLEPPVTKATLSELDVAKIIHNPKLRHDINFDPELHFRPNLDGEKGRKKQQRADQFWESLRDQLQQFITDREGFALRYGQGEDWCLPMLLRSVKEIIQTLVPSKDRICLDEGLNVDLIMQQFSRGMADLEKLASWLSGVLKSHCAPMRDQWVDQMYSQLTNGNRTNNMEELVQGLRSLLSVLEAMKLDVANHQIRCLRPILIEDTVHFEQRFFMRKILDGKLDRRPAHAWYSQLPAVHDTASLQAYGDMASLFEELVHMIMPSYSQHKPSLPNTFLFDEERIAKLRSDVLQTINLEVAMRLYETYEDLKRSMRYCEAASPVPSPYLATPFSDASGYLSVASSEEEGSEVNFHGHTSRPSSVVYSAAGSANSSPRSSLNVPSFLTARSTEDSKAQSQALYESLLAVVQDSTGSRSLSRWKGLADRLATEIFRSAGEPKGMLGKFEERLTSDLGEAGSPTYSPLFLEVEHALSRRLRATVRVRVKQLKGQFGVALFSMATGGRMQGQTRTWDGARGSSHQGPSREQHIHDSLSGHNNNREESGIEDMATRLAHLGLLHWRVWAQLVYLSPVQEEDADVPMGV
ncbi:camp-mediated signaling protein Sok1 [Xylariaceae sp. FL0594]|nr:camp-mediated signaling protein Sok1 [Xylariaceae sp. FL0594]